jgi:cytochrome c oxidase cbb3-type subunit I/II
MSEQQYTSPPPSAPGTEHDSWHRRMLEDKGDLFAVLTTVAILVGGVVEIVPMYTVPTNLPHSEAIKPWTPLELAGRDIYIREGCVNCHSQMVRPMRAETLRYGEWTRAAELQYDHPFLLGSRRIGPDLQRLGAKYPDAWHWEHLMDPRGTSPGSVMPAYAWLATDKVDPSDVAASVRAMASLGVPYADTTDEAVAAAMKMQSRGIVERLAASKIEATGEEEMVALIAYLQRLGVDGRNAIASGDPVVTP